MIDLRPQCLIDETRPTGFEIPELIPDLVSRVRLHIPNDSRCVRTLARPNELELVFIDADHRHPRPLLDLLRLAPYVRSGGWIVLHDIQLGAIGRKIAAAGETSPWGHPMERKDYSSAGRFGKSAAETLAPSRCLTRKGAGALSVALNGGAVRNRRRCRGRSENQARASRFVPQLARSAVSARS
jgi:hypothetical protein